ncbi:hypothetical protein AB0Y04_00945 [Loigolactobacillus coryniformis]|uniref:hypothetical protein n=1 Tax=Loigolactobacillus coryniformis TaxID=1610 RepID=UPI003F233A89
MDFATYTRLGFTTLTEEQFKNQYNDAKLLIDNLTNDYYVTYDVSDDLSSDVPFLVYRATQYQKAIAYQCEFAVASGASTIYEQKADNLKTVSVGRTSLSTDGNSISDATYGNTGVVTTAVDLLARTGLLYRGVRAW